MNHLKLAAAAAAFAFVAAGSAQAQTLYSDTFSRTTGSGDGNGDPNGAADNFSDWGTNDNLLGGTNTQAWIAGPDRPTGGRNAVTNGQLGIAHGTTSFYNYDAAAVSPLGFDVSFDFSRFVTPPDPGPGGGGYIAFGFGVDSTTTKGDLNDFTAIGASDFSILFQQANNGNAANAEVFEDNVSLGNFDYLTPDSPHSVVMNFVPQTAGAYGSGDLIDVTVTVDNAIVQSFTTLGGDDFGTFAVSANNFDQRYIDNLVVSSAPIPEPTSVALLALGGVGLLARRRR